MKNLICDVNAHRSLFHVANIVFWILGWGSLGVGIWLYVENSYIILAPSSYSALSSAGLCIGSGAMVLIISFVGCIGMWIQSKCLLFSYFSFVCLLFVVQCTTGFMGLMFKEDVRHRVRYSLHNTVNRTYAILDDSPEKNIKITWDHMQSKMQCCGVDNYTDWFYSLQWPNHRFVPDSCCDASLFNDAKNSMLNCGKSEINKKSFYQQGCYEPFTDYILQHLYVVGLLALCFVFVELFVLISSGRLLYHFHKRDQRYSGRNKNEASYSYTSAGEDGGNVTSC